MRGQSVPDTVDDEIEHWEGMNLTWAGHDYLDSIRDDQIWAVAKDGVKQAGGLTFDLLKSLAKGLVKKKIEQHTGVNLDI